MLSFLYFAYIIVWARIRPSDAPRLPKEQREQLTGADTLRLILRGFVPIVSLILFVLGSIFFGLATPSEGAALGALVGIVAGRVLSSLLYGVSPRDPLVLFVALLVPIVVAAVASYLPARRASRVDPVVALRYE